MNEGFWKSLTYPGILEGHVHTQDWIHAQKRPEKTLNSHLQLTLRLWTCRKWKLWQRGRPLGQALKSTVLRLLHSFGDDLKYKLHPRNINPTPTQPVPKGCWLGTKNQNTEPKVQLKPRKLINYPKTEPGGAHKGIQHLNPPPFLPLECVQDY